MKKVASLLTLLLLSICSAKSAEFQKLLQDTQRMTQKGTDMHLVWWIPNEFWEETLKQNPHVSEEQIKQFVAPIREYSVFTVIYIEVSSLGERTLKTQKEIEENTKLIVDGLTIDTITPYEVNPEARKFFAMMKPSMAQMLGEFGKGLEFLVYPNYKEGKAILDPMSEGSFSYTSFGETFEWQLPLGSLLPPVIDPETGEQFPGNYKYNPYTGTKLTSQ